MKEVMHTPQILNHSTTYYETVGSA